MRFCGMRKGITIMVDDIDCRRLETITMDRNAPQKHVGRCGSVLLSVDGVGTHAILDTNGAAKTR